MQAPIPRFGARAAAALALAVLLAAPFAHADPACIAAYEQTQTLRKDGRPVAARTQAVTCARDSCPVLLAKDCTKWLAELDALIPTVVLDPRSASGAPRTDVRVKVDGAPLTDKIDGKAVPVDPGSRKFVFDAPGAAPVESTIVLREGERQRKITVSFTASADGPPREGERPIPLGVWIFGGVSVVALTASAIFAIDALGKKSDLDDCKPRCAPEDVDAMSTRFTLADVTLGAGVMAGAAALYLFLTRPTAEAALSSGKAKPAPYGAPMPGGAAFGVISQF